MARKGRLDRGLLPRKDAKGRSIWYVRLADQGRERWFGSFQTKTEARTFYEARKLQQLEGRFFPSQYQRRGQATVPQLIEGYMEASNKRSKRDDRRYAKLWVAHFGNAKVGTITAASVEAVRQSLLHKGLAPSSTNRALAFLRHVLNRAVRDGVLNASPMAQVKFLKESPGRLRFLRLAEEALLCEEIGPPYGNWIRLAILTGLRQMEQFSLRWECVDQERALLTIPHTKAGGTRYVHLNAEAVEILRGMNSWTTSQWVFPSENPGSHLDPRHFYARIFLPAVKRLGFEGVSWHTLRHTFASRLAMAGATEQDIATCLGHSTTALVRRYAHLSPSHLKNVVERVSTFGQVRTELRQQEETQRSNSQTANSLTDSSISVGTVIKPRLRDQGDSPERM
jgi:site-specific recombinase XerD